jgi:hypothetical protein
LNLEFDILVSNFAFKFNLCRYNKEVLDGPEETPPPTPPPEAFEIKREAKPVFCPPPPVDPPQTPAPQLPAPEIDAPEIVGVVGVTSWFTPPQFTPPPPPPVELPEWVAPLPPRVSQRPLPGRNPVCILDVSGTMVGLYSC